jgi:hypothetical protein
MSARKTPVLLREGTLSGRVYALLRYRRTDERIEVIGEGREDVTADFDAIVCDRLLNPAPGIIEQLDGVAKGQLLTAEEKAEVRSFREALIAIVERHNAGPHVRPTDPKEEE